MLGLHSTLLSVHTDYLWHVIYHMRVSLLQPELHSESSLVREQSCDTGGRVKSSHVIQRQTERYPHTERCTSHVKGCIWVCSHSWSHSPPRPNKSDKQRLLKQCCIWHSRCQMAALCSHNLFTPSHASHTALPPQPCCPPTDDQEPTQHFPFHPTLQLNCPGGSHNAEHRWGPGLKHPQLLYSISNNYDNDLSF